MGELALGVWPCAFVALELAADFKLQPPRVFAVDEVVHVDHSHSGFFGSLGQWGRCGAHGEQKHGGL